MVKPGIKSTEWWVVMLNLALSMLNHTGMEVSGDSQLIVGGISAAYVLGRSIVKAVAAYVGNSEVEPS